MTTSTTNNNTHAAEHQSQQLHQNHRTHSARVAAARNRRQQRRVDATVATMRRRQQLRRQSSDPTTLAERSARQILLELAAEDPSFSAVDGVLQGELSSVRPASNSPRNSSESDQGVFPGAYAARGRPFGLSPHATPNRTAAGPPPTRLTLQLSRDDCLSSRRFEEWLRTQEEDSDDFAQQQEQLNYLCLFDAPVRRQSSCSVVFESSQNGSVDLNFSSIPPELRPVQLEGAAAIPEEGEEDDSTEGSGRPRRQKKSVARSVSPKRILTSVNMGTRKIFDKIIDAF